MRKPYEVKPLDHMRRILELTLLCNALDGDSDEIDAQATKNIYLSSCPAAWRRAYATFARDIRVDSLAEVA